MVLERFAELVLKGGESFVFIQPGIAPCGKLRIRQPVMQSLFRSEGFTVFIEQKFLFQRELNGSSGNAP